MALAPATAAAMAIVAAVFVPWRLPLALPVLMLWFASPAVALGTRQLTRHRQVSLHHATRSAFRKVARRTWRFFDDLVGPADHWLIPDNIQEDRRDRIAHRTSPTNIGLQLLSTLAAYDFGYLNVTTVLSRLEPTFATLLRMQRYRGHFYNWYDTTTLAPLAPAYISTVDSGNLAGYLVTLRAGLAEIERAPIISETFLLGVGDVIELADREIARAMTEARAEAGIGRAVRKELAQLHQQLAERPVTFAAWVRLLTQLRDRLS